MPRKIQVVTKLLRVVLSGLTLIVNEEARAQDESIEERRVLVARDVCVGPLAKFGNTDRGEITFQDGRFSIERAGNSVTVFENSVRIAELPDFTYKSYSSCLDNFLNGIEKKRRAEEALHQNDAFFAGYELAEILSIGICLRSAAMGGFFFGDMQSGGIPFQQEQLRKLLLSASKSITRRMNRLNNEDRQLDLDTGLNFYNFFPDRSVPYFDQGAALDYTDQLTTVASAEDENYINLGLIVGRMNMTYQFGVSISEALRQVGNSLDPRSQRVNQFFPPTMNCLVHSYSQDTLRLQRALDAVKIMNISVPSLMNATSPVDIEYFNNEVTAKIRQSISDNN